MAMNPKSATYEIENFAEAQEFFHSRGWTDGFPVVPLTPEAVGACLECANALFDFHCRSIHRLLASGALCIAGISSNFSIAAEPEPILLSIEGHLVGRIESLVDADNPARVISAYYGLIPEEQKEFLERRRESLASLLPAYRVAFTAADSAELAQVVSDIDTQWAEILAIHAREFTREVQQILVVAYGEVFPFLVAIEC